MLRGDAEGGGRNKVTLVAEVHVGGDGLVEVEDVRKLIVEVSLPGEQPGGVVQVDELESEMPGVLLQGPHQSQSVHLEHDLDALAHAAEVDDVVGRLAGVGAKGEPFLQLRRQRGVGDDDHSTSGKPIAMCLVHPQQRHHSEVVVDAAIDEMRESGVGRTVGGLGEVRQHIRVEQARE